MFGKTPLILFDWQKYQKQMRRYKQGAFAKVDSEIAPIEGPHSSVKTYKAKPFTLLDRYPELANVFEDKDQDFVLDVLTSIKPFPS